MNVYTITISEETWDTIEVALTAWRNELLKKKLTIDHRDENAIDYIEDYIERTLEKIEHAIKLFETKPESPKEIVTEDPREMYKDFGSD